ncbi:ribonuclease E inhibitor RraB [Herbaspirillum robiniae]|uniref:Ribonuclease E inhibitor RraB n=1 Tax=Herbaspirillum robiniae TaxID=2014887 RepID=A0ABX2M452_9BURK|nr:ribonuclease E inhibitor RraB [Herbaspirillum robiniae]NUU04033.1 ribonuclease E inhibitor RraB [Herbaspirillum robiniae]
MKLIQFLLCSLLVGASLTGFSAVAQTSIAEQQDARVIENLQRSGADLTKTHNIDFFLVFDHESDAVAAAENIRARGYEIANIEKVPKGTQWEVHAKRKMAPEIGAMQAITRDLSSLAANHRGYYDGWGTVGIK